MTARTHATLDLGRFRYTAPAWWEGFQRGRAEGRNQAINEQADWRAGDWQRGKIREGVET